MKTTGFTFIFLFLTLLVAGQEKKSWPPEVTIIGITNYDVQSSRAMQNRIFLFDDGTIGAMYNFGLPYPQNDIGIGYNYFNGSEWNTLPVIPFLANIAKNPSYTKFMPGGEIFAAEGENGLFIKYRIPKGTGNWLGSIFSGPPGFPKLYSPQIVTSGVNNEKVHLLAMIKDTSIQLPYQDNICKILYSRSSDAGITWDIVHQQFEFTNGNFGFSEMSVVWAEPNESTIAFAAGDYFTDLILMKSEDEGNSWQETIIWEHPFPYMQFGTTVTDTFWTHSGSMNLLIDDNNLVNLVFSIGHIRSEIETIWYNDLYADGIAYWRENMPLFPFGINSLHPDTLFQTGNLVGWSPDINGDSVLSFLTPGNYPQLGLSTMPTLCQRNEEELFLAYSAVYECYNNGIYNYRHLLARESQDGGGTWGPIYDLTSDLIYIFEEISFPVCAPRINDEHFHLIFQKDLEPGLCEETGKWPCNENQIAYMKVLIESPSVYLTPSFYAQSTTIEEGDSVLFINTSTGYPDPDYFEWTFEGGTPQSSNLENPTITYNTEGTYDVTLYVSNGPMNQTLIQEDYITVLPGTGTRDFESVRIDIMPNPSSGKFRVNIHGDFHATIIVYNLLGEEITQIKSNPDDDKTLIDLSDQNEGIYFVKIKAAGSSIIRKIMLSR
ncbi:MAG: T9SS type A sorting domain-containing protein [Bacteroidetes bacterium]|nr:T9SS type A sorting domain-containing protein [Bacteroidota bacterium]